MRVNHRMAAVLLLTSVAAAACSSTPDPQPSPTATTPPPAQMGSTITTKNGGELTISEPSVITPTAAASGVQPGAVNWSATLKFVNGAPGNTNGNFEPGMLTLTASAGGTECVSIFQGTKYTTPSTPVLPGRSISFPFAFSCAAPAGSELLVNASSAANSNAYLFAGTLP